MHIRPCTHQDSRQILTIINAAAAAYQGVIPEDCWSEPYMPPEEMRDEIARDVEFWGAWSGEELVGVMGLQNVGDVSLIRHAYVHPDFQRQGIGSQLLHYLRDHATAPMLVGTWAAAEWAIDFYEQHGFRLVDRQTKDRLLQTYWNIPDRQRETSVVLADEQWCDR